MDILNAASVWKGKEGLQQDEWSFANKRLQELICVVLQGYSFLLCNFSALNIVFSTNIALSMHTFLSEQ